MLWLRKNEKETGEEGEEKGKEIVAAGSNRKTQPPKRGLGFFIGGHELAK